MTNKHIIAPPTKKGVLFLTFPFNNALTNKYNKVTGKINEMFCKAHATTPFINLLHPVLKVRICASIFQSFQFLLFYLPFYGGEIIFKH